MKNKPIKLVIITIALLISPLIIASIFGGLYVLVLLFIGQSLNESFESLLTLIEMVKPYIHFLTVIPIIILFLVKLLRKKLLKQ